MLKRPQRKRPLGIKLVAGAYLGFPLLGPLFMWLTYRDAPDSVLHVMQSLDVGSWLLMASVVLVGYGISQVRPWGWYLFLAHSAFVMAHNVYVFRHTSAVSLGLLLAANGALLAVAGSIVRSSVRAPYFNPRLRYWEQKPRVAVRLEAMIGDGGEGLSGETFDVSESGAFLCCSPNGLTVGAVRPFALAWPGGALSCDAEVVWVSNGERGAPAGVGLRFRKLDRAQRARLGALVARFLDKRQPTGVSEPARRVVTAPRVALVVAALAVGGIAVAALCTRTAPTEAIPVSVGAPLRAPR